MSPPLHLVKDESILELLSKLAAEVDPSLWHVVDHWEADLFALGISSARDPQLLVYVSTRRLPPRTYFYECETPPRTAADGPYRQDGSGSGVSLADLMTVIRLHLGIPPDPERR